MSTPHVAQLLYDADHVVSTCWCEARYVRIPAEWVGDRTATCGSRECRAIESKWRERTAT